MGRMRTRANAVEEAARRWGPLSKVGHRNIVDNTGKILERRYHVWCGHVGCKLSGHSGEGHSWSDAFQNADKNEARGKTVDQLIGIAAD